MSISSLSVKTKQKYKLILLGDQAVGKTCLIQRFVNNKFEENESPTVGIDFVVTNIHHNGKYYRLQLWDTAGQQRFKSLIPSYLRDSQCALILYDVTSKQTYENISKWLDIYLQNADQSSFVIIVGNKCDLKTRFTINQQTRQQYLKKGIQTFEVSAKTGSNVNQLFNKVIQIIEQKSNKPILDQRILETIDPAVVGSSKDITSQQAPTKVKFTISPQKKLKVQRNQNGQQNKKKCC